jgi:hypothetical protein
MVIFGVLTVTALIWLRRGWRYMRIESRHWDRQSRIEYEPWLEAALRNMRYDLDTQIEKMHQQRDREAEQADRAAVRDGVQSVSGGIAEMRADARRSGKLTSFPSLGVWAGIIGAVVAIAALVVAIWVS